MLRSRRRQETSLSGYYDPEFLAIWRMLGRRWTVLIMARLGERPLRFGELKVALGGISGTVLSERLAELERRGLVARTGRARGYRLTESACELEAIISGRRTC